MKKIAAICVILAATVTSGLAKTPKVYTDPINGFSFTPPTQGFQTQPNEKLYLARWMDTNKETRQVLWALTINRWVASIEDKNKKPLTEQQYSKVKLDVFKSIITRDFKRDPNMNIASSKIVKIGKNVMIELRGTIEREVFKNAGLTVEKHVIKQHYYQAWIRTAPRVFVTLRLVTGEKQEKQSLAIWEKALKSIKLFDAKKMLAKQQKMSLNAEALLRDIEENGFQKGFHHKPLWFMVLKDGKAIGWFSSKSFRKELNNRTGIQLSTCAKVNPQSKKEVVRLVYQTVFLSDDLDYEQWLMRMQIGVGEDAELVVEKGLRQQQLIFCNTFTPGLGNNKQQMLIPKLVKTIYLPRVIGTVLPAFIELDKPGKSYTFAEYSANKNDFVMREVNVIGPENIEIMGKTQKLTHLKDRSHRNQLPADAWVDSKGKLLKTRTANGIVMEACSQKDILIKFPNALKTIDAMRKASITTRKASKNDTRPYWMGDM